MLPSVGDLSAAQLHYGIALHDLPAEDGMLDVLDVVRKYTRVRISNRKL